MDIFFLKLLIYLAAAVVAVPVAKYFKLGSVLGYLMAGIVIGPFLLSLVDDVDALMHLTEFGVVLMLFLVGLELRPSVLWKMRTPILGMGGTQVLLTALVLTAVLHFILPWKQALAAGLTLSLSSTAVVLQTLREKGLLKTSPGQSSFSVLLFQDIAVIPMLAFLPLLGTAATSHGNGHHLPLFFDISSLPNHLRILAVIAAITAVIVLGRYISRPLFRAIAATRVREVFSAAALALVIGISMLMVLVGLSPALGSFLAGVVLADSEYRHELESNIEPFKGLLLGIFFISIGASLDFRLIGENIDFILGAVALLILIKLVVLLAVARIFRMPRCEMWLFAVTLAQGGEFAFVLFKYARTHGVIPSDKASLLISVAALSMFLVPFMFILYEKLLAPRLSRTAARREADSIASHGSSVILAGFGRLGTDLGRMLMASGVKLTILDHDETNVEVLRRFGFEVYYGDVTRPDLLEAAGASDANILVIAIDDHDKALQLVDYAKHRYPHLKIAVSASDRVSAYEFLDHGVDALRRKTFGTAVHLGQDVLRLLGFDAHDAYRRMRIFCRHEKEGLDELYRVHRQCQDEYISLYRRHNDELAEVINWDFDVMAAEAMEEAWATGSSGNLIADQPVPPDSLLDTSEPKPDEAASGAAADTPPLTGWEKMENSPRTASSAPEEASEEDVPSAEDRKVPPSGK